MEITINECKNISYVIYYAHFILGAFFLNINIDTFDMHPR